MDYIQKLVEEASKRVATKKQEHVDWILRRTIENADSVCESPIEMLFLLAWIAVLEETRISGGFHGWNSNYRILYGDHQSRVLERLDEYRRWFENEAFHQMDFVLPQYTIGEYRVDFLLIRLNYEYYEIVGNTGKTLKFETDAEECPRVIVECDGHEYHEKTREQARRDKARDRFLQAHGFHVLRFTGSELVQNPLNCADEVDRFIREIDIQRRRSRHSSRPLKTVVSGSDSANQAQGQ
jgi:very-short-patch-repair endonuclease